MFACVVQKVTLCDALALRYVFSNKELYAPFDALILECVACVCDRRYFAQRRRHEHLSEAATAASDDSAG